MTTTPTTTRIFNFAAGPAVLPRPVLEEAQRDLLALPGVGMSVMEISHRSKTFEDILHRAIADIRALASIPENYKVLLLQGGARGVAVGRLVHGVACGLQPVGHQVAHDPVIVDDQDLAGFSLVAQAPISPNANCV